MDYNIIISEIESQFNFLDNIESAMSFPHEFVKVRHSHIQPLSHFYMTIREDFIVPGDSCSIQSLTTLFSKYVEVDEILKDHLRLQGETLLDEWSPSNQEVLEARIAAVIRPSSKIKSMIANYIALLNWETPITTLFESTMAGNTDSLFKLVQVDKSALTVPSIANQIIDKQLTGDWEFFQQLGKAISAYPLSARKEVPKAVVVVAHLWDQGFKEMKFREITALLREHKILPNSSDYDYFKKQLHKFGLKKTRYNKK